jgi:hypothetical protein
MQNTVIPPSTISFLTTFQCTSSCKNCCFGCTPKTEGRLSLAEMKDYLDCCLAAYPESIKVLVLTGGECMLLGENLLEIISYAKAKGLMVRIVTNGYWAKTYETALARLGELIHAGLHEINFSTGDDHMEWVPYDNIVYGCMASFDLGITCIVNVEKHDKASFRAETFYEDERLKPYFGSTREDKPVLRIESGVWIKFDKDSEISYNELLFTTDSGKGCTSLFNTIVVNPYSQVIACCGLTSEYILPLRLGSAQAHPIKNLYESQFNDFLKIWLFVEGPMSILKFIYSKRNIPHGSIKGHICYICAEIFKDPENIASLKEHYKEAMARVLLKYSLLTKSMCLT